MATTASEGTDGEARRTPATKSARIKSNKQPSTDPAMWTKIKLFLIYFILYFAGIGTFLVIISEQFAMQTYFSDNSLIPGLANREFTLVTEAEYYIKLLDKLVQAELANHDSSENNQQHHHQKKNSLATLPSVARFITNELDNFGLEVHEQNFSYMQDNKQYNGTNIYSIIRGERATSSESIILCVPFRKDSKRDTLSSVGLALALAKHFSRKSYWAKDVIVLLVDRDEFGLSAWLDSYYDVNFRQDIKRLGNHKDGFYYDSLPDRSGPMQAAIVLELNGRQFTRMNIKIQGMYGQLPNLDLFNLVVHLSAHDSVTPYFHSKTLPYGSDADLFKHHLETAMSFIQTQATMRSDGLHGLFLRYAVQSLTMEAPEHTDRQSDRHVIFMSLLNVGRLMESIFRSLNNLSERFNRSYYFYIIVAIRRFTSIGYYMIAFGLMLAPLLLKAYMIHRWQAKANKFLGARAIILLATALVLSVLSTFNISTALLSSLVLVPILSLV